MESRRMSFQGGDPPPQAIQLVHDMIQSYNCFDAWDYEPQDIWSYRDDDCLHEYIPAVYGNTGLSNSEYVTHYRTLRQSLDREGAHNFTMELDEIFASLNYDRIAVTTLCTAQYSSRQYVNISCVFVLQFNPPCDRITHIHEHVGPFLQPFIGFAMPTGAA
ncbi:hypothetical protein GGTG_05868 [Gaeumannomyces tritici R3-111a-1]|uniref:SnoaL-like domain-containing protein n=1 Tax=Gaeumannomyces tritici (strain R3-111a-1) TaxID=644352 RepID=J3NX61_GAET3|nr:hypothetical protein GGTG_05868 [Gaeumannomyces tritici R3-111a-1]EJT75943.1 hypothetical protein GGTG_05868 [Gaeumannomyces tritici R3-111a-1]